MSSFPSQGTSGSRQTYGTPLDFIRAVEARFGPIDFDLAADAATAKASAYYSPLNDSLAQDWSSIDGNLWLNPPFGSIEHWAAKCAKHVMADPLIRGRILLLTPASVGTNWYRRHVFPRALTLFLSPRMSFDGQHPYPKDLMLSVFSQTLTPGCECWNWKTGERDVHSMGAAGWAAWAYKPPVVNAPRSRQKVLSPKEVFEIRQAGVLRPSTKKLSEEYGVSVSTIQRIIAGKLWARVK